MRESRAGWSKFTETQKHTAVSHFLDNGRNASETVRVLGYPSRTLLSTWIDEITPGSRKTRKDKVDYSLEQKIEAVVSFCERDTTTRKAAIELGVDRAALYDWKKELLGEEAGAIVSDIHAEHLPEDIEELREQKAELERDLYHAKLELALRKGAIELVKKTWAPIRRI